MSRATSSANPAKLAQFSEDGISLGTTLTLKAGTLRTAADDLAAAGESIAGLATFVEDFEDLVLDWLHLDQFAGAVAAGFLAYLTSRGLAGSADGAFTVPDSTLAPYTQVGVADRDEAIRLAELVATQLGDLRERGDASPDEIEAVLARAARGMYDPAFAVTLSEALGVEGYVDIVGMIRQANHDERGDDGIDHALASVGVLATILTTALGRAHTSDDADDADDADDDGDDGRPDDQVLDESFVEDLAGDYDPGNLHAGYDHTDLSVLVAMTDPPTAIAVEIANNRMSATLYAATLTDFDDSVDLAWGDEHSGIITNYAVMLSRNPDASAEWLGTNPPGPGGRNIELVLRQDGDAYIDDGRALAQIVENGVTHPRIHVRHDILAQAIAIVGAEGDVLDNSHMPDALAAGAAANMAFVDHLVNVDWDDQHLGRAAPESAARTHQFFRELMLDQSAANRVYAALEAYSFDQLTHAPGPGVDWTPGDGIDRRTEELESIGSLQGVIAAAEGNAHQGAAQDYLAAQGARASSANFLVGLAPYGAVNDLADVADVSIGGILFPADFDELTDAELVQHHRDIGIDLDNAVLLALVQHPDRIPSTPVGLMSNEEKLEFLDWAASFYNSADHNALRAAYGRATSEFLPG